MHRHTNATYSGLRESGHLPRFLRGRKLIDALPFRAARRGHNSPGEPQGLGYCYVISEVNQSRKNDWLLEGLLDGNIRFSIQR